MFSSTISYTLKSHCYWSRLKWSTFTLKILFIVHCHSGQHLCCKLLINIGMALNDVQLKHRVWCKMWSIVHLLLQGFITSAARDQLCLAGRGKQSADVVSCERAAHRTRFAAKYGRFPASGQSWSMTHILRSAVCHCYNGFRVNRHLCHCVLFCINFTVSVLCGCSRCVYTNCVPSLL